LVLLLAVDHRRAGCRAALRLTIGGALATLRHRRTAKI
jgi:hypothetical protein